MWWLRAASIDDTATRRQKSEFAKRNTDEGGSLRVEEEEAPTVREVQTSTRVLQWLPEAHPLEVLHKAEDLTAARRSPLVWWALPASTR